MKVQSATFIVEHKGKTYRVEFEPERIAVKDHEMGCIRAPVIRGKRLDYKPCATHAMELVKLAIGKPVGSEFAKQRWKRMKPALGVVGE